MIVTSGSNPGSALIESALSAVSAVKAKIEKKNHFEVTVLFKLYSRDPNSGDLNNQHLNNKLLLVLYSDAI